MNESAKMASDLYHEIILVPFMARFVVFAKRHDAMEARLRIFCMTDDKMDKLLENREHFKHVARSVDVEVDMKLSCYYLLVNWQFGRRFSRNARSTVFVHTFYDMLFCLVIMK